MPGIGVGVDGSVIRSVQMAVHQLTMGYLGGTVEYPDDAVVAEKARKLVQTEVDEGPDRTW